MRLDHLLGHLARIAVSALVYRLVPGAWAALPAGGLFLAAFCFAHDLTHGALRLPARANHVLLALAGGAMLGSGHGMRVVHLRHHAVPLDPADHEGAAARLPLARALVVSAWLALDARRAAWVRASRRDRRWQLGEHAATLALALVVGRVYVITALTLQLLAPLWAGRLPHTAPSWLVRAARSLAWTRSVIVLSLAFHEEHHARPAVPTFALGEGARRA